MKLTTPFTSHARIPALTAALTAAGAALLAINVHGQAVESTFFFSATVAEGPFAGTTGTGSFTYPTAAVEEDGLTVLDPTDGLSMAFNVFGQDFTQLDDADYDFFPELALFDGVPVGLDFLVSEEDGVANPTEIAQDGVFNFHVFGELIPTDETGDQAGTLRRPALLAPAPDLSVPMFVNVVVPEPSGVAFAAVSGLGLGLFLLNRRWRRAG